jgi:hypothetical protein
VPRRGVRCLTRDLGPSVFTAITTYSQSASTTQVLRFGTPSGTTVPGPRAVVQRQGLLGLITKVEPEDAGLGPPIVGPRVSDIGPLLA